MNNIQEIRDQFPILGETVHGKPLIYLDNAATTQKPRCVIDAISNAYCTINANVHRGIHHLSQMATEQFEAARESVRNLINARHKHEIIFTSGTTESINLVASSYGALLKENDEIIISTLEHHSNIVPWQLLCERNNAKLKVIPLKEDLTIDLEAYKSLISERTALVSIAHVSNVLGATSPVKDIIEIAHKAGAKVLVDGAQSTPHTKIDVQELDADFFVFSGHKMYAPTGIGVLYGKEELLEKMPPYKSGGEMIQNVRFEKTTFNELPYKFEAGTPNYIGAIAFRKAIEFMQAIGIENISSHEKALTAYALNRLGEIDDMRIIGRPDGSAISFLVGNIHPADLGTLLDRLGIAIRTGHHCAQPLIDYLQIPGTARASFAVYNTFEEIDALAEGIKRVSKMFR